MSAAVNVHRELAGFQAIAEFPDTASNGLPAIRDACWIAAWMPIAHSYNAANPLTAQELVRLRADMTSHGDWTPGGIPMSMGERYLRVELKAHTIFEPDWSYHGDGSKAEVIHQALKVHAGINGAILQLEHAYNLPGNEGGVNRHFVGIGGLDSMAGYLVANGDDVRALNANKGHATTYAPRWYGWNQLLAAVPTALLVIVHPDPAVTVGVPQGWSLAGGVLTAPNGLHSRGGFKDRVLGSSWNPANVPLMDEVSTGADAFQIYRDETLEMSAATGIISHPTGPLERAYLALSSLPPTDPNGPAALALLKQLIKLGEAV